VLAAHAAGLTTIVLPERNEPDLDEVPLSVREQMQFHAVTSVDEVLALALEPHALAMVAQSSNPVGCMARRSPSSVLRILAVAGIVLGGPAAADRSEIWLGAAVAGAEQDQRDDPDKHHGAADPHDH
jgi:hypothetical protein